MDELIAKITEKTGISEDQARTAVSTVLSFIEAKLPAPIATKVRSAIEGGAAADALDQVGNITSRMGGVSKLFGKD